MDFWLFYTSLLGEKRFSAKHRHRGPHPTGKPKDDDHCAYDLAYAGAMDPRDMVSRVPLEWRL